MRIHSVNYITSGHAFRAQKQEHTPPLENGLKTAGAWFGFGVALDLISRNVCFSKSPMKNSIAINSILASTAGAASSLSSVKKNKNV